MIGVPVMDLQRVAEQLVEHGLRQRWRAATRAGPEPATPDAAE